MELVFARVHGLELVRRIGLAEPDERLRIATDLEKLLVAVGPPIVIHNQHHPAGSMHGHLVRDESAARPPDESGPIAPRLVLPRSTEPPDLVDAFFNRWLLRIGRLD